jgi:ABC-type multidrug transport system fused ATPase/permease subunit
VQATVAENIRFSRAIDDAQVERAARLAHIHDDIVAMPDGYDTAIGQRADAVSGGQRQRICLARALAGDPSVLVLDEPTSALDKTSEAAIRSSLLELRSSLTMFIVTHQPSMLAVCDQVIQVDSGRAHLAAVPAGVAIEPRGA